MAKKVYVGAQKTYSNTLFLLHGDSLTDSSIYGHTITNSGVTISTAQSKFGGKSMYFNGSSYLRIGNLLKGNQTFTIDCWVYPTATKNNTIWSHGGTNIDAVTGGGVELYGEGTIIYYCNGFHIRAGTYSLNTWQHIAIVGNSSSIKIYKNGSLIGTYDGSYNYGSYSETIGANDSAISSECFQGYIDELRISNVVRWTSNFTPPTSSYNNESLLTDGPVANSLNCMYLGVNNVASSITKGYIGVGGLARPFFGKDFQYYGPITPLSVARYNLASASVGNYAIFCGGIGKDILSPTSGSSHYQTNTVDAYDISLTRSAPPQLVEYKDGLAATTIGDYAVFGGGYRMMGNYLSSVDAYNNSLTRSSPTKLSSGRSDLSATSVGNYALFGGGRGSNYSSTVDAYDTSLTRSIPAALSVARDSLSSTMVGNYAIFGGGCGSNYCSTVDAYNSSLTRSSPTALSVARDELAATNINNYAIFAGGEPICDTVDVYDSSLTRSTISPLSVARRELSSTTIKKCAIFAGGTIYNGAYHTSSIVDIYNDSLVKSSASELSGARSLLASTTVGNYALFGGGQGGYSNNWTHSDIVDVYLS